jgi:hypothetical protein
MPPAPASSGESRRIPIRIDSKTYPVEEASLTGAELRLVPDSPIGADRDLYLDVAGPNDQLVDDDDHIELAPQMTFFSVTRKINPGQGDVELPRSVVEDVRLDGGDWSFEQVGRLVYAVRKGIVVPTGLAPPTVDLLLKLPAGFPTAAPDMFWVTPALQLEGGRVPRGCGSAEQYNGRCWQRWSRHIAADWRPGIDGLGTYLAYVRRCLALEAELGRGTRAA